jgi:triacylglycerol lipase
MKLGPAPCFPSTPPPSHPTLGAARPRGLALAGSAGSALLSLRPRPCVPPIFGEVRTIIAAGAAVVSRPAHGLPAAAGGAQPVLLIPGFSVGDASLHVVRRVLRQAGHDTWRSQLRCNLDCSERAIGRLVTRLEDISEHTGRRVALVGHSRGGLFARVLAARRPDLVSGVVTLGSPFRDQLAVHPLLWANLMALGCVGSLGVPGVLRYSCAASDCCEDFRHDLVAAVDARVGYLSVYSRRDGVVDWRACVDATRGSREVTATHVGMVLDRTVINEIAVAVRGFAESGTDSAESAGAGLGTLPAPADRPGRARPAPKSAPRRRAAA